MSNRRQQGVVLIELAVGLPLFLIFLFFFVYLGITYNAKNSLRSAMENATRSALTRGKLSYSFGNYSLYQGLDTLCTNMSDRGNDALMRTLYHNVSTPDGIDNYNETSTHWSHWLDQDANSANFCRLPLHQIYAIIFTQAAMEKSVGGTVRFPCDPADTREGRGGAGCLRCIPLNPCSLDRSPLNPPITDDSDLKQQCDLTTILNRSAISCEYRPDSVFVTPIDALISLFTGSRTQTVSTVRYTSFFDIPVDYDWY